MSNQAFNTNDWHRLPYRVQVVTTDKQRAYEYFAKESDAMIYADHMVQRADTRNVSIFEYTRRMCTL